MKKILIFSTILSIVLFACRKEDDFIQEIEHSVKVTYGEIYNDIPAPEAKVIFLHKETGRSYQAITNNDGEATIKLQAGTYRISTEKSVTETQMQAISGMAVATVFSAAIESVTINSQENKITELKMKTSRIGGLVIKQIYYAGSNVKQGASFRDQFIEIYNNSNEEFPLAGLAFAQRLAARPSSTATTGIKDGKYDWSQSAVLSDQGESANTDYVYMQEVLRFPSSAPNIKPGESVIVAATAINHKNPLVVGTETFSVADPSLTIDLSMAKYECYYADYFKNVGQGTPLASDIDNPSAVNMEIVYKTNGNRDLILNPQGRMSLIILYANDEDINQWRKSALPTVPAGTTTQNLYLQVPISKIIDGVNFLADRENQQYLAMPTSVDASGAKTTKGAYSSQSVIRKHTIVNGRKVYQDTNNSSSDFQVLDFPDTSSLN